MLNKCNYNELCYFQHDFGCGLLCRLERMPEIHHSLKLYPSTSMSLSGQGCVSQSETYSLSRLNRRIILSLWQCFSARLQLKCKAN